VVYDALLEDCGKYAKVAKSVVKKMKRFEEDHKSTLKTILSCLASFTPWLESYVARTSPSKDLTKTPVQCG